MALDVTLEQLERAAKLIYQVMPATPQRQWPLLNKRAGAEVWVKHENYSPIGAFKVRGGIVYIDDLKRAEPDVAGVISATRGNHGQSVACAAARAGLKSVIVVPKGNSVEKNAAMEAQGAELVVHGEDFQEAYEYTAGLAAERGLHMLDSFDIRLVQGVGTYSLELLSAAGDLDTVYVPIGMGSGICGLMAARDALGRSTKIVGVVAENAPSYALSFAEKRAISTNTADTMADGMACRVPHQVALDAILAGTERVVRVSEEEIKAAMRHYFTDTHNIAEGAGAAPLAALLQEKSKMAGKKVGVILSGGNVDKSVYQQVLSEADT